MLSRAGTRGAKEETRSHPGSKPLWYGVWGVMGLVAATNALAPHWILSGRWGLVLGILLTAVAAMQLAQGNSFLGRREFTLAKISLVLFGAGVFGQRLPMIGWGIDFAPYYIAGHLAAEHPTRRLYYQADFPDGRTDPSKAASGWQEVVHHYGLPRAITFVYPPFFAVLLEPFAHFSFAMSFGLWNSLTVLLTLASVSTVVRLAGRHINVGLAVILVVGLFSYGPFFQELMFGQVSSFLLFLYTLGVWLLSRDRDWPSAFCFAIATMIKMTPIIAVPLLAIHRRWRWLTAYCCWMAGLMGFSVWQAGWPAHEQFIHSVIPSFSCGVPTYGNVSIMAFVQELFLRYVPMGDFASTLPPFACLVSKVGSFVVLALLMIQFYRYRREDNLVLHLVLLLLLSLVISPITWLHHYVIALLPFLYLWCREQVHGRDYLLLATVLVVGTNVTCIALPLSHNHRAAQLVLAGIVPCLTLALVYFRASGKRWVEDGLEVA